MGSFKTALRVLGMKTVCVQTLPLAASLLCYDTTLTSLIIWANHAALLFCPAVCSFKGCLCVTVLTRMELSVSEGVLALAGPYRACFTSVISVCRAQARFTRPEFSRACTLYTSVCVQSQNSRTSVLCLQWEAIKKGELQERGLRCKGVYVRECVSDWVCVCFSSTQ